MTKEEYLTIVDRETNRLHEEEKQLAGKLAFYEKMRNSEKEVAETQYKLDVVRSKLFRLQKLAKVEAKIRIQAMNDELLKNYQDEKIKEFEEEIKDLKQDVADIEESIRILEQEIDQLASSGNLSNENISKAQIKKETIQRHTFDIRDLNKKIADKTRELQEIQSKTLEQVREMLLAKAENKLDVDFIIDLAEKDGLSNLDNDISKAQELSQLRRSYTGLKNQLRNLKIDGTYYISNLPVSFAKNIREVFNQKNQANPHVEIDNPDRLIQIIEENQASFLHYMSLFKTLYEPGDIALFIGKDDINNIDPHNIDLDAIRMHRVVVGEDNIKNLANKIKERDDLESKFIKTKKTQVRIEDLNNDIATAAHQMYQEIIAWFNKKVDFGYFQSAYDYYGQTRLLKLDFSLSLSHNRQALRETNENIEKDQKAIYEVHQQALKHKEKIDERKKQIQNDIDQTLERISSITGRKETSVYEGDDQEKHTIDLVSLGYQADLLKQIREEAQKQVEMETERLQRREEIQGLKDQRDQLQDLKQLSEQVQDDSNKTDEEGRHY